MGAAFSVVAQARLGDCSGGIARSLWTIATSVSRQMIPPDVRSRQAAFGGALLFAALGAASSEAASPYPPSNRVTSIQWLLDSHQATEEGGDIWPVTWAANGSLLAAWGDGVVVCPQKASYGVAAIASDQPSVDMTRIHCGPGPDGLGKMMAIVATPDAVYTRFTAQDGSSNYPIWKSVDGGATWIKPAGTMGIYIESFVQFGRANAGAPDGYIYALAPGETDIRLTRVRADRAQSEGAYEFYSGNAFGPAWKVGRSGSTPIFADLAGIRRPTITYNPDLDRYLLTVSHSKVESSAAHKIGIFEAPNPWGPWRTISYTDDFLGTTGGIFYFLNFPIKWQADSGATLWATYSCYSRSSSAPCGPFHDRFNLLKATLDVQPEPPPPNAGADAASTNANTPALIAVLANDAGNNLIVRAVTTPTNGTARTNTDDSITYTPKTGYTGSNSFTYLVSDGFEQTATATVEMTVLNRPPVAGSDTATTVAPASVRISVLTNDTDPDGHSLTITGATTAAHGTTTISTDRKAITYKPTAGYSGSDSFTYTIGDNHGGTGQGVVTVAANNRPPIAAPDSATTTAGKSVRISVLANDSDPDGHSLSVAQITPAAHGKATVTSDRRAVSYAPAGGYAGGDTFTYTVSDGYGGTAQASVSVSAANRPPVAAPDSASTPGGREVKISVLANDSDPDGHSLLITGAAAPAHGATRLSTDRRSVFYKPATGYIGPDSFAYTVGDGYGGTAQATVTLSVQNRPPVAAADSVSTAYNTSVRVAVLTNDSDPDGHGLIIAAVTAAAHGTATISTDRKAVVYRPTSGYRGSDSFTYTASDGYGGTAKATVAVTVRAP